MAITKTALDAKLELAITDIGNGSYQSARANLLQAEAILVGLPDYSIGNRRLQYREQISGLIKHLDQVEASGTTTKKNNRVFGKFIRE